MASGNGMAGGKVIVDGAIWDEMRDSLVAAIDGLNMITSHIAAHEHHGKYTARQVIEHIDLQVRSIRNLLELIVTPL